MKQAYPWQATQWQQIQNARANERLPHAILLHGAMGMGKAGFAHALAASLICEKPGNDNIACGHCAQCALITAGNHPDKIELAPEKEGGSLGVDPIRQLSEQLSQTRNCAKIRIAIVHQADHMTRNAANALLKTLEEPSGDTIILLLCANLAALPATIVSRCQRIHFPNATQHAIKADYLRAQGCDDVETLLELNHGAPLAALLWQQENKMDDYRQVHDLLTSLSQGADPIEVAAALSKVEEVDLFDWTIKYLNDLIRNSLAITKDLVKTADTVLAQGRSVYQIYDRWLAYQAKWRQGVHLNKQLQCETLCFELQKAVGESQ